MEMQPALRIPHDLLLRSAVKTACPFIDTKALDETTKCRKRGDKAKLGDKERSNALRRLHQVSVAGG